LKILETLYPIWFKFHSNLIMGRSFDNAHKLLFGICYIFLVGL
jgi:hypothetical protein